MTLPLTLRPRTLRPRTLRPLLLVLVASCSRGSGAAAVDPATGLVADEGFEQVRAQCTACHSALLITQNRSDRDGWLQMIRWMQETQGLWPLGENEPIILDYLARNYGPIETGRRKPLEVTFE